MNHDAVAAIKRQVPFLLGGYNNGDNNDLFLGLPYYLTCEFYNMVSNITYGLQTSLEKERFN
jgi:hypothetical protein